MLNHAILGLLLVIVPSLHAQTPETLRKATQSEREGDYGQAIVYNTEILSDTGIQAVYRTQASLNLARLSEIQGNLDLSMAYILKADSINQPRNDTLSIKTYWAKGHYELIFEQNEKAKTNFEKALEISKSLSQAKYTALSYIQISSVHHQLGDYLKAQEFLDQAKIIIENNESDPLVLSNIYKKTGDNYYLLHQIKQSKAAYEKSLHYAKPFYSTYHDYMLRLHNDLGAVNSDLGNTERAKFHLNQIIRQEGKIKANHAIADAYYYLSLLELDQGNHSLSIDHAKKSVELFRIIYGDINYWVSSTWVNLADMHYYSGDLFTAVNLYHQAFLANDSTFTDSSLDTNPNFSTSISKVYYIVAMMEKARVLLELYLVNEQPELLEISYKTYLKLLTAIQKQRQDYGASRIQLEFGEDIYDVYGYALRCNYLLFEKNSDPKLLAEAVTIAEQSKAFYLSLMSTAKAGEHVDNKYEGLEKLMEYKNKERSGNLEFEEGREFERLLDELKTSNPELYLQLFNVEPFSVVNAQTDWIKNDELVLEYSMGNEGIHILAISNDSIQHIFQPVNIGLDSLINAYRGSIINRSNTNLIQQSFQLYDLLIEPIYIHNGIRKLKIIPDQQLHYVPFETLVNSPENEAINANTPYLIKKYAISYIHSAFLGYYYHKNRNDGSGSFLGFAPSYRNQESIPAAIEEVNQIASITHGKAYIGNNATVEALQREAEYTGMLHFSGHAQIDNKNPNQSYLILRSDSTDQDIKFYSREISMLKLNSQMVCLSACNTGSGILRNGEGVLSLARDFAMAGAPCIMMSLWPAVDKTSSEIVVDIYQNLSEGKTKSEAIRSAKLNFLKESDNITAHPYYWAHLVIIGDEGAIKFYTRNYNLWWLLAILLVIFSAIIVYYFRSRSSA